MTLGSGRSRGIEGAKGDIVTVVKLRWFPLMSTGGGDAGGGGMRGGGDVLRNEPGVLP